MSEPIWQPEARPVPAELEPDYPHAHYPPKRIEWATIADQLDSATMATLMEIARGGIGEPHA